MMKRWIAVLLALMLLVSVMTACDQEQASQEQEEVQEQPQDQTQESADDGQEAEEEAIPAGPVYVWNAELTPITIDASYEAESISAFCASGSNVFFAVECKTEPVEDQDPLMEELYTFQNYQTLVFAMDSVSKQIVHLSGYVPYEIPEGWGGYANLNGITPGADGTVWVNELVTTYRYNLPEDFSPTEDNAGDYYEAGLHMNRFIQLDAAGQVLRELELTPGTDTEFNNILADAEGYVYASNWDTVQVFDPAGAYLGVVDQDQGGELVMLDGNTIGVRVWISGGSILPIDPVNLTLSEGILLSENHDSLVLGHSDYQYVYNRSGVLYGHMADAEADVKILSLLDADVDSSLVSACAFLDDGSVAAIEANKEQGIYQLVLLREVDASMLPQKQELTLACLNITQSLRADVVAFNRSNDDIRIIVKDYSEWNTDEDYTAGLAQLKSEMFAGQMPDILYVDPMIPLEQLGAQGLLMDLWTMIDQDSEFGRDDLMTHFFDVLSTDGKLYQVTDSFAIQTAVGLKNVIGDRTDWTWADLLQMQTDLGDDTSIFAVSDTRSDILRGSLVRCMNSFLSWNDQGVSCNFEGDEFISLLEFANSFPEEYIWSLGNASMTETQRLKSKLQLLKQTSLNGFEQIRYDELELGSEQVVYAGYPTLDGNGSYFTTGGGYAISASCQNPELAWSFVRTYLTEEHQKSNTKAGFPTNRNAFETAASVAMTAAEESNELYWVGNMVFVVMPLTQTQYDTIMTVYNNCNTVMAEDGAILKIVNEEASAFFNGEATAAEAAAAVQMAVLEAIG